MPTIFSHAAVPLAIGLGLGSRLISPRLLILGVLVAALPDLDVLAFRLNVAYTDSFGHRGASHSIVFSMVLGLIALLAATPLQTRRLTAFLFIACAAASHGILDMFTNGGHGVAVWWPFSTERFFFPWQVIEASPLSLRRIFGMKGLEVLASELLWIWLPAGCVYGVLRLRRRSENF